MDWKILATPAGVIALVNLAKRIYPSFPDNYLTLYAVLLSMILTVLPELLPPGVLETLYSGLLLGLAASGVWDVGKRVSGR